MGSPLIWGRVGQIVFAVELLGKQMDINKLPIESPRWAAANYSFFTNSSQVPSIG
jgi:hypothetical protein